MNKIPLKPLYIYRMIHFKNLEYILTNGICSSKHPNADPNYINIGDSSLIKQRDEYSVGINPPGGTLGEYIPFYFAGQTPMLYRIKKGYSVEKYPQEDIIFICCDTETISEHTNSWCYTDGHAKSKITEFFNDFAYLNRIDWKAVHARYWKNDESDMDRTRKKQAEFLVKDFIPVNCIHSIIVRNEQKEVEIQQLLKKLDLDIPVEVDTNNKLYYND